MPQRHSRYWGQVILKTTCKQPVLRVFYISFQSFFHWGLERGLFICYDHIFAVTDASLDLAFLFSVHSYVQPLVGPPKASGGQAEVCGKQWASPTRSLPPALPSPLAVLGPHGSLPPALPVCEAPALVTASTFSLFLPVRNPLPRPRPGPSPGSCGL